MKFRLLFCFIDEGFDKEQIESLNEVRYLVEEHGVRTFDALEKIAEFINKL